MAEQSEFIGVKNKLKTLSKVALTSWVAVVCFVLCSCGVAGELMNMVINAQTPTPGNEASPTEAIVLTEEAFEHMETFFFDYTDPMAGQFQVDLKHADGGEHLKFVTYFGDHVEADAVIVEPLFEMLADLCKKHEIHLWDDFSSPAPDGLMDASNFRLEIKLSNGEWISAGGFGTPENYDEFYSDLEELVLPIAREYSK